VKAKERSERRGEKRRGEEEERRRIRMESVCLAGSFEEQRRKRSAVL
jgi:hypothetical protein